MITIQKLKKYRTQLLTAIIITIVQSIIINLFIKNIYVILEVVGEETLGTIFRQLKDASITSLYIIPAIIYFLITNLIIRFNYSKYKALKIILTACIYIVTFSIMFVVSLLLSKVNGILFVDVLVSLLKNMGGLGL